MFSLTLLLLLFGYAKRNRGTMIKSKHQDSPEKWCYRLSTMNYEMGGM